MVMSTSPMAVCAPVMGIPINSQIPPARVNPSDFSPSGRRCSYASVTVSILM